MRVLIVKLSSLGDVIQTLPALHDLRAAHPGVAVDWVVEEAFAPLLRGNVEGIERVIAIAQRRWRRTRFQEQTRADRARFVDELRAQAYDAVIDFQGLIKSALVARSARLAQGGLRYTYGNASESCGYEWPVRYMVDRPVAMPLRVHAVQRYRLLAAGALGYEVQGPARYDLRHTSGSGAREVMLAHGTTRPDNEWPAASWIDLGHRLQAEGWPVRIPQASDAELAWAETVCAAIGQGAEVLPRMSLAELPQRMAACAGVIGVDSGLSHLAVALDLPHVQIFSQPRAWRAGPVNTPHQLPVGGAQAPSVDEVWRAWQAAWAAAPGRG